MEHDEHDPRRLLTLQEVAKLSGISVRSLLRLRRAYPQLDRGFLRLGRSVRIQWESFLKIIQSLGPLRVD
jgi:hypothetical protein